MNTLQGISISPGLAEGQAFVYGSEPVEAAPCRTVSPAEVEAEHRRFEAALERAAAELQDLAQRVLVEFGRAQAQIVSAHLTLLRDPSFIDKVRLRVSGDLVNIEHALQTEITELAATFTALENAYLREREQDIRDVGRRLLRHLARGGGGLLACLPPRAVLVADELFPSDTLCLDREHLAAIVTERGGQTSHAAILARSLGVPAVSGVADACLEIANGAHVLVDGDAGQVAVAPDAPALLRFSQSVRRREEFLSAAAAERECVTRDGVRIALYANVGRVEEIGQVARHRLEGVGLFRTEYLFLEAGEPLGPDTHREAYRRAAAALGPQPLVVRTLDLGDDKRPVFRLEGPCPGLRGLRLALVERSLLTTQLRALLDVASECDLRVLFPMVLGGGDFREAVELLRGLAADTGCDPPPVGAMIETPASLFMLDEILDQADFLSIGTNDLTQYMLAADRNAIGLVDEFSVLHPAVFRAVAHVVAAARARGRPVCVCGEAAGDPQIAPLLVGLGLRELSMSPVRAARVRHVLRQCDSRELERRAQEALTCETLEGVRRFLLQLE